MAWSTPLTAVSNATLTAAQWNASVRDNLLETSPAKATAAGRIFVSTGANAIAERVISGARVLTEQTTTSATFTDLATVGPSVTVTTGVRALIFVTSQLDNTNVGALSRVGFAVSGASTIAADVDDCLSFNATGSGAIRMGMTSYITTLTAGSNTFTLKYLASSGTGTFGDRHIAVIAL